jgi:hypothetical protein
MRASLRLAWTALVVVLVMAGLALAYISDSAVYPPPSDYLNPVLPAVGLANSYPDPTFTSGSSDLIWRISDARNTPRADGVPGNLTVIQHEYSTTTPFSQDKSFLLLLHQAYFALYDGDGRFIRNLLLVCPTCAPRWSRSDPSTFYYRRGLQMYSYNAQTDVDTPLGAPLPYDEAFSKGEDDICFDGDHLVGFGRRGSDYYLYIFSIGGAQVISERRLGGIADYGNVDSSEIAPGDNVIVSYVANGPGANAGIWAFDLSLNSLRQVTTASGHHDVGVGMDGSPILVWTNSASFQALANCQNGIERVSIDNPLDRQCLMSGSWTLAYHVSLPDQTGWAFVSTYTPGDPVYGALTRIEESSPFIISIGGAGWTSVTGSQYSGGKAFWSDNDASRLAFAFYGTRVRWIATKDAASGIAQVSLDGQLTNVDLYSSLPLNQAVVFDQQNLPLGFHQLLIAVTPDKNPESSGNRVWVDAIEDDTAWTTYSNEILQVRLDGGEIRRLAHHRSRPFNTYTYSPKVSTSRDGKKLVWGSNYGLPSGMFNDYADEYMMSVGQPSVALQTLGPDNDGVIWKRYADQSITYNDIDADHGLTNQNMILVGGLIQVVGIDNNLYHWDYANHHWLSGPQVDALQTIGPDSHGVTWRRFADASITYNNLDADNGRTNQNMSIVGGEIEVIGTDNNIYHWDYTNLHWFFVRAGL